jgi:hypothetical protein
MYALYTSKVKIELTAMSSAEAHEVTAMNRTSSKAIAPPFPRSVLAAKAAESPEEISEDVGTFGYVGKRGLSVKATADRPRVVAKPNGIAHHARPTIIISILPIS